MYQLTHPIPEQDAQEIANRINKDYAGQAATFSTPKGYVVKLTPTYFEYCRKWVLEHCRISDKEPNEYYLEKAKLYTNQELNERY